MESHQYGPQQHQSGNRQRLVAAHRPERASNDVRCQRLGNNPTIYKTTNGGVDWDPLTADRANALSEKSGFVQTIAMDPANPQHLAVTFHDTCTPTYNSLCFSTSADGGETWQEFSGLSSINGWQEAATITILGPTTYLYTCAAAGAWYTNNGGQAWQQVLTNPIMANYSNGATAGPDGALYLGVSNTGLFVSRATAAAALGILWTLIPGSPQASALATDGTTLGQVMRGMMGAGPSTQRPSPTSPPGRT